MLTKITDINWDTDGEDVDLPTEVEIDLVAEGIAEPTLEVADWLSDRYGWLVNGFKIAEQDAAPSPR